MSGHPQRRTTFRRYSDRRCHALLTLHEVFFYEPPGTARDAAVLDALCALFDVHRSALVSVDGDGVAVCAGNTAWTPRPDRVTGPGIVRLRAIHTAYPGALTLSRFRRSPHFEDAPWDALWSQDFGEPITTLLSVPIDEASWLWLLMHTGSKEWSSHDRDLAEEVADLLRHARTSGRIASLPSP